MPGFVDYLRMTMGWWSKVIARGPYCFPAKIGKSAGPSATLAATAGPVAVMARTAGPQVTTGGCSCG